MNKIEKDLFNLIEQDGCKAPIQVVITAFIEYAHHMSDMGLKEKSNMALEIADMLGDLKNVIEE